MVGDQKINIYLEEVVSLPWISSEQAIVEQIKNDLINRGYSLGLGVPKDISEFYRAAIPSLIWLKNTQYIKRSENSLYNCKGMERLLTYFSITNNSSTIYCLPTTLEGIQKYISMVFAIYALTSQLVPVEINFNDLVSSIRNGDSEIITNCERPGLLVITHPLHVNQVFKSVRGSIFNLLAAREKYKRLTLLIDILPQQSQVNLTKGSDPLIPLHRMIKNSQWGDCNMEGVFYSGRPYWIVGPIQYMIELNKGDIACQ